ncbi:beta-galactosidase [Phocaeicola abscessus]
MDRSWTSEEEVTERVNRYKDHPALFGYYVYDEPSPGQFSEVAEAVKFVQNLDRQHPCYVNLFPNLGNPFYREYVDNFIKTVPVPFLSFDHYPVLGRDDVSQVRYLRPEWYENLEIIADASRQSGRPFWAFALATAHHTNEYYPVPTLADLRLQIYSNLAYGAQGIQYFTYFTPTGEGDTFHDGPFYKGSKTKTYYTVKEMNAEIRALSGVFFDSNVLAVFHAGDVVPKGTRKLDPDKTPPLTPFSSIETEGKGAVVSFLEKENIRFMVVVNRDLMGTMKLNVALKKNAVVRQVLKNGVVENQNMQGSHSIEVEPGDVVIFAYPKVN